MLKSGAFLFIVPVMLLPVAFARLMQRQRGNKNRFNQEATDSQQEDKKDPSAQPKMHVPDCVTHKEADNEREVKQEQTCDQQEVLLSKQERIIRGEPPDKDKKFLELHAKSMIDILTSQQTLPTSPTLGGVKPEVLCVSPLIFRWRGAYPDIFEKQVRSRAVGWSPSEVLTGVDLMTRKSDYCELELPELTNSVAQLLSVPTTHLRANWVVLRYQRGDYVKRHTDYLGFRGKTSRLWTFLVYLNDVNVEDGGATVFPEPSITIQPRAGDVVLFRVAAVDPEQGMVVPDVTADHMGCQVKGDRAKYVLQNFVHER